MNLFPILAWCLCLVPSLGFAQGDPVFEAAGFQQNRDYFSHSETEHVDTLSGHLVIQNIDLALPGNAGKLLRFGRNFSGNGWHMGPIDVALKLQVRQPGIGTGWALVYTGDGGEHRADKNAGNSYNSTPADCQPGWVICRYMWTDEWWLVDNVDRKVYLPDGTVNTYGHEISPPTTDGTATARLTKSEDPFGNVITFNWTTTPRVLIVTQELDGVPNQAGPARVVNLTYYDDQFQRLAEILYQSRRWTYRYHAPPLHTSLADVESPVGTHWRYDYNYAGSQIAKVTTPLGGETLYTYKSVSLVRDNFPEPGFCTPLPGDPWERCPVDTVVVASRQEVGGGTWTYDYLEATVQNPAEAPIDRTTVVSPSDVFTSFEYQAMQWGGLRLTKRQVRQGSATSDPLESETQTYVQLQPRWSLPQITTLVRDGLTYAKQHTYNYSNTDTHPFSEFGRPTFTTESGPGLIRTTLREYEETRLFQPGTPAVRGGLKREETTIGTETAVRSWSRDMVTGFLNSETTYGVTTSFENDGKGNVGRVVNGNGHGTTYAYEWGIVSSIQTPLYTISRVVNSDGTVASETRGGRTTTFEYDDLFRITLTTPPSSDPFVSVYDDAQRLTHVSRGGFWTRTTVDGFGRPVLTESSTGARTTIGYDLEGRKVFESVPFPSAQGASNIGTEYEYDAFNRTRVLRHKPDNTTVRTDYLPNQPIIVVTDELNRPTRQTWQALWPSTDQRLVAVRDADAKDWFYEYNVLGKLTSVNGPGDADRQWRYEHPGRPQLLSSETHPESGTVHYGYDGAGNLHDKLDSNNTYVQYGYDDNERLVSITATPANGPQRVTTLTYENGTDNRKTALVDGVLSEYDYDAAGYLRSRKDTLSGKTYQQLFTYDGRGNMTGITYATNRHMSYNYDDGNRITKIRDVTRGIDYAWDFQYRPSGALTSYRTTDGVQHVNVFEDTRERLIGIHAGDLHLSYSYDAVGNVTSIGDDRPGMSIGPIEYDAVDRLRSAPGPYGSMTFTYDAAGNRTSDAGSSTYIYQNQRLVQQNQSVLTYDNNGNLKTATLPGASFEYTPDNHLAASFANNTNTTYRYDADGWRIAKTVGALTAIYTRGATGQLMSEFQGSVNRDYIYAGSRLIATVRNDSNKPAVQNFARTVTGGAVNIAFTAASPVDVPLASATLRRAAASAYCSETDFNGCGWSAVDSATAPANLGTWTDTTSLSDTPPAGSFLYSMTATDISGAAGDSTALAVEIVDLAPDPFAFPPTSGVVTSTLVTSAIVPIAGITGASPVTVAGAGTFRVCTVSDCAGAPAFGTTLQSIANGQWVQLRATSSASYTTPVTTTLTVGGVSASWTVTTGNAPSVVPAVRSASSQKRVGTGSLAVAKPTGTAAGDVLVVFVGVRPQTSTITPPSGQGWTQIYRVDQSSGTPSSIVTYWKPAGASEPATYDWTSNGQHTVIGMLATMNVNTTSPLDVFGGAATASSNSHTTPSVTTTAANALLLTGHALASSGTWTAPGGMTEHADAASETPPAGTGESMAVSSLLQTTAGASGGKTAVADAGSGGADTGAVQIVALRSASGGVPPGTTLDPIPNQFTFADQADVPTSSLRTSNRVQIGGINVPVVASIAGGAYRVCPDSSCTGNPPFVSGPSTITNGQYLELQVTSSANANTTTTVTMTVGGVSDAWTVATQDTTPNPFTFNSTTGAPLNSFTYSACVQVTGITGTVPLSVSGTEIYAAVNNDPGCTTGPGWVANPTTPSSITNGQYIKLNIVSGNSYNQAYTGTITVGTYQTTWSVTTVNLQMTADHAIRGCSDWWWHSPVYQGSATECLAYCVAQNGDACEWHAPSGECYVEFGTGGCYVEPGWTDWHSAVIP